MPTATAMLDTLLPAAAGTPVVAPGVQDAATAGLFSSKLSEVLQAANIVEAPAAETAVEIAPLPVGRLSLPSLALAAEADAAEPVTSPVVPGETIVETPDQVDAPGFIARPAPTPAEDPSTDAVETAPDAALAVASFLAPAPLSGLPAPVTSETADVVVESDAAQHGQPAPSSALPAAAVSAQQIQGHQIQDMAGPTADIVEDSATPLATLVAAGAAAAPSETARAQTAEDQSVIPVQNTAPRLAADASITPPAPVIAQTQATPLAQPVQSHAVTTETAEAEQIAAALKAAAPMAQGEVKVTTQPAVTRQAAQTVAAAVAVQLAAAEVAEPTETDPLTGETADAPAAAPQTMLQTSAVVARTAASVPAQPQSQPAPETSPQPQVHARALPVETVPTTTGEQTPSTAPSTAHVSMAEAGTSQAQPSVAAAPDAAGSTAPVIDVAVAPLDPSAPVEAPAEARTLETAAAAAQPTNASALSRATIETTAQLAAQIARKLEGRSTRFDMVLTPEDLGRVDVSLEIGSDGQLAARLAFDNPAAAADLRGRADELRRQLQDAGFQIAQDSLDFTQRDASSGGGFSDRQQQQRQSLFAGGSRLAAQADLPPAPPPGAWINHSQTRDRVDVRV